MEICDIIILEREGLRVRLKTLGYRKQTVRECKFVKIRILIYKDL